MANYRVVKIDKSGQLGRPEVPDDGGVSQLEDRLRDEGPEGRHREPPDLPVPAGQPRRAHPVDCAGPRPAPALRVG